MFVSKAGHHEHCQNLFFFCPAWTSHSHSHSLSPSLTLSLPSYCVCCFMEGLDAVQIAVANRDCLSSPPVARHSIHKQITPARETLSCYWTTTSRTRSVSFLHLSFLSLSLFTAFSFSNFPLLLSAQLPLTEPSLLSLSDSLLLQPQQGRATDSLLCVNLSVKWCVCVWECVRMCPLGTLLFKLTALFGSGRQAFFFGVWERRGDPRGAVIWLNKQPGSEQYLLQRTPGTAEINLRLWTSEGSIHLKERSL